ncbi:CYTH domain-containing protein [Shewanella sp. VB17]|uniref:CYTH domain-containing protein n=1 Tax=Shewanella sp. VB17 TaxID=2739432 RepID=UPI00156736E8|nr:CYTH domain-containing protein [Shewanella sp. VB17]NRD75307.1 CYTH domain-containing protein [Shewanella sp. VB17]
MDAEIELKLFFQVEQEEALIQLFDNLENCEFQWGRKLTNAYFDTADIQLRRWDMGLRVRGCDGALEQTIKTAGTVVGGIHSRPEFNVDIEQNFPILKLFPEKIWPKVADISSLQSGLTCLFNTHFLRRTWHISVGESLIEVALDMGKIEVEIAGELITEPICELEFELLKGEAASLIHIGLQVAEHVPVRLGQASKAQRGYRLAEQAGPLSLAALTFMPLKPEHDLQQALITLISTGLEQWQLLEAMIVESVFILDKQAFELCVRLRICLRLLRCVLLQFNVMNTVFKAWFDCIEGHLHLVETELNYVNFLHDKGSLNHKAIQHEPLNYQILAQLEQVDIRLRIETMLQSLDYGCLQLALVELLFALKSGEKFIDNDVILQDFADQIQESSWLEVLRSVPLSGDLSCDELLAFVQASEENLCVGITYGAFYSTKAKELFTAPWNRLLLRSQRLLAYRQLSKQANMTAIEPWLADEEESLLSAMEHTRTAALNNVPYWR